MSKNILLTGCSRGVGLEIAKVLINNNYMVWGISRSLTAELQLLLESYPNNFKHLNYDLADSNNINIKIFKEWIGSKTPIHGFVNNAAIAYDDIITNMNYESIKQMFDINTFSPILITKYVLRNMLFNKCFGSIIHISSISVHTGYKGLSSYAASKGAIEAFSKNTSREWGELGIRSNSIIAGFMETDMSGTLTNDQKSRIYQRTSLKKATSVKSVANTVEFLLSNKSESVTGQNIYVDSGTI